MGTRRTRARITLPAGSVAPADLMKYRAAWEKMGISESGLHRLIDDGEIQVCPAPRRNMVVRSSVDAYIARHSSGNGRHGRHKKPPDVAVASDPQAAAEWFSSKLSPLPMPHHGRKSIA